MESFNKVAAVLKKDGVVICPTDTVYGFLADASNKKAVEKIYNIKRRPKSKPLSVFVKNITMAKELAEIDDNQIKFLKKYWPGKYTFILKRKTPNLKFVTTVRNLRLHGVDEKTIALRIPNHKFLQQVLQKINRPLAQTSVNISSQKPLNSIGQIMATFGKNRLVGLIVDGGDAKNAKPSKIINLTSEKLTKLRG